MAAFLASFTITFLYFSGISSIQASKGGFSVELIHRDSPNSPFYNPSETPYQRVTKALQRSINRVHLFDNSISSQGAQSEVYMSRGEYLMKISIGTPPFEILGIADTGSDLIWTQCKPCDDCYSQVTPLFDPSSSKTYRNITCKSIVCQGLPNSSCAPDDNNYGTCIYHYSYGDRSFSNGNLGLETITLGSTNGRSVSFPKSIFGCGHDNAGTFDAKGSGIIGLGGGPISLVSQMGSSIDGKFSYCLVPIFSKSGNSSTLSFGSNAVLKGSGVQSTPLVSKDPATYYYLTIESFSVGSKKIDFSGSSSSEFSSEGNIIIDSGTTLTILPQAVFSELTDAVDQAVGGTRVEDPSGTLSLCYSSDSLNNVPTITVHFTGADVQLDSTSTFIKVADGVVCFAFLPSDSLAIFGNLVQMNYMVAYDLSRNTVSFKKTDCAKVQ